MQILRRSMIEFVLLVFLCQFSCLLAAYEREPTVPLSTYNLAWDSPSVNSSGSMIAGNGEIGINMWVENGTGDVVFYISRTDSWSENGRLLKVGMVRISFDPNPFINPNNFMQELMLQEGEISVTTDDVNLLMFVDANYPTIRIKIDTYLPTNVNVSTQIWRQSLHLLPEQESFSSFGMCGDVWVYPDDIYNGDENKVVWYHRNVNNTVWYNSLSNQGLGHLLHVLPDPIMNRTFGAAITGTNLIKYNSTLMTSSSPTYNYEVNIFVHTNITSTAQEWINQIQELASKDVGFDKAIGPHEAWWNQLWQRSWIQILPTSSIGIEAANNLTQMYYLQRWMDSCSGRGNYAIKFNGLIFTVDVILSNGYHTDPDYRAWGGAYWFQNTRQPYWTFMATGDFDMAMPLFDMYTKAIPLARERTKVFFGHDGIYFPETSYFFGAYTNEDYGCNRTGKAAWWVDSPWERYHYNGGIELVSLMLEYYQYTLDTQFLQDYLFPFADEIMAWWSQHYPPRLNGEIVLTPAQAIETLQEAINPLPDIAGLRWNLQQLLSLPNITSNRYQLWTYLMTNLPPIPTHVDSTNNTRLSPAEAFLNLYTNSENPELYAIFPYRFYQVTKPDLQVGIYSFNNRRIQCNVGWCQDVQEAALLGLTEVAAQLVMERFFLPTKGFRFPTFWGKFFDWIPEEDHGATARLALQWMLTQPGSGDDILMFPAWPEGWDVDFKMRATKQTEISGVCIDG